MKPMQTAKKAHVTEQQKAWARLALLTTVGLVCPPLAAARSGVVWGVYLLLVVLYSLWTVRATQVADRKGHLGYLICAADAAVLVPILVWSLGAAMPIVLSLLWVLGAATSWRAAQAYRSGRTESATGSETARVAGSAEGAPLERALRVRLRVLATEGTRFALVVLRLAGHAEMVAGSGREATKDFLREAGRRSLRLLGTDAQLFPLPAGRMAFVFAADMHAHDTESVAMALATEVCSQSLNGYALECVAGWATAPADGTSAADLMYAAESGALSNAAFRRVAGSPVSVPEPAKRRAVAG